MPAVSVSRPWRRYLRFSVRGLIVLVLLIGLWLGRTVHNARVQRQAVSAIRTAGGHVWYYLEKTDGTSWWPNWLVARLGVDYLDDIRYVFLSRVCTDADLVHVGRLSRLVVLKLGESSVTDTGLVHLRGLTKLSILGLSGTRVSDAGLAHLKGLTNLSELDLRATQVTDAGLEHLTGLTNLEVLWIENTRVSDRGMAHLKGLTKLSDLNLGGTQVTDAGLVHLNGLTKLSVLKLDGTRVTDAGMKELKQALPSLFITPRLDAYSVGL